MTLSTIGHCSINFYKTLSFIRKGHVSIKNILIQAAIIGFDSAPIAIIISLVSGSVLTLQISKQFIQNGADAYIGGLVAVAIIREMAPLFAALAVGARAGTAIAAEIANMKVTEQIDALKVLKVDPIYYLVLPRAIAGAIMLPIITILAEIIGILGGMIVSKMTVGLHYSRYLDSVLRYTETYDIYTSLIKAMIFGILIAIICSTIGLLTHGGAKEVGKATTKAAIWTASSLIIVDLILTWIFYS